MKFKNIVISLVILVFGVVLFTGCNGNVNLKLTVNGNEGIILCDGYDDVTSTATYKVKKKSKVILTAIPANDGYEFQGWNNGKVQISDKSTYQFIITKNTSLTAKFYKLSYTLSFDYNTLTDADGNTSKESLTNVQVGDIVTFPVIANTEDKQFMGWYYGETKISDGGETAVTIPTLNATDKQQKSFTVVAKYRTQRTITFNIDGQTTSINCFVGDAIQFPAVEKEGYHFSGWTTTDGTPYTATTLLEDADLTLVADLDKIYTVSFAGEGIDEASVEAWEGKTILLPTYGFTYGDATKFMGWEYNGEVYSTSLTFNFNSNITLNAEYANRYTISYYSNGGEDLAGTYIYQGDKFADINLPTPTRTTGCSETNSAVPPFKCWTYKNEIVTTDTVFDADHDISLVAQWEIYCIQMIYQAKLYSYRYVYATANQLLKDVLPYTTIEQASYITTTEQLYYNVNSLLFYTLNSSYNYTYCMGNADFYKTVAEFSATARTMAQDGVETQGFTFTDETLTETFEFADDYGTPRINTDINETTDFVIATTTYCATIYGAFNK